MFQAGGGEGEGAANIVLILKYYEIWMNGVIYLLREIIGSIKK